MTSPVDCIRRRPWVELVWWATAAVIAFVAVGTAAFGEHTTVRVASWRESSTTSTDGPMRNTLNEIRLRRARQMMPETGKSDSLRRPCGLSTVLSRACIASKSSDTN